MGVDGLEEEARIGKAGTLAAQLSRLGVVVLDELGYLPFARSGGQLQRAVDELDRAASHRAQVGGAELHPRGEWCR